MKVFVTGVAGQLGHDVVYELTKRGHVAIGSDVVESEEAAAKGVGKGQLAVVGTGLLAADTQNRHFQHRIPVQNQ